MTEARKQTVLVVDDVPENLRVVGEILRSHYEVKVAVNGTKALALAGAEEAPDLILLDVMMPGLDGYEVCRKLKMEPRTKEIPVIFLTALSDPADKLKAFEQGGVDFVTKPFYPEEVLARVRVHLELKATRQDLAERNRQLQKSLDQARELERMRDGLVHMMAHDMRTPLMAIKGNLELLQWDLESTLQPEQADSLRTAFNSSTKLVEMISAMLNVSKLESGQMAVNRRPCDLAEVARQAIETLGSLADRCNVSVSAESSETSANVDPELTQRVLVNLLGNALKFTPAGGDITLILRVEGAELEVAVKDTGPGVPPAFHERIFEKFGQVQSETQEVKYSTGLGLTFCKLAVEAMGGRIGLTSELGSGSTFWVRLPRS